MEELVQTLEANDKFVDACHKFSDKTKNGKARQFTNTEAGKEAWEAKMAFLESISSDPNILPERMADRAELKREQDEERLAWELQREADEKNARRMALRAEG